MTIKSGQKMYRVRGPDGRWVQKTGNIRKLKWVENEDSATFWRKLHHLKASLTDGMFSDPDNLEGVPVAAFQVYEYEATIDRTGRRRRLSELDRFHRECEHKETVGEDPDAQCKQCGVRV